MMVTKKNKRKENNKEKETSAMLPTTIVFSLSSE